MKNLSFDLVETSLTADVEPKKTSIRKIEVKDEATSQEEKLSAEVDNLFYSHAQGYMAPDLAPLRISRRRNRRVYYNIKGRQKNIASNYRKNAKAYIVKIAQSSVDATKRYTNKLANTGKTTGSNLGAAGNSLKKKVSQTAPYIRRYFVPTLLGANLLATAVLAYFLITGSQQNNNLIPAVSQESITMQKAQASSIEAIKEYQQERASVQDSRFAQQQNQLNCLSMQQYLSEQQDVRALTVAEKDTLRANCAN